MYPVAASCDASIGSSRSGMSASLGLKPTQKASMAIHKNCAVRTTARNSSRPKSSRVPRASWSHPHSSWP
eukprot:4420851-Prymnesium_polylepis.2